RLGAYPGRVAVAASSAATHDQNPLVRAAALAVLEGIAPRDRVAIAAPLLGDDRRAVRIEAAWLLAPVADSMLTGEQRTLFTAAGREFIARQRYNADRPDSRAALAAFSRWFTKNDSTRAP